MSTFWEVAITLQDWLLEHTTISVRCTLVANVSFWVASFLCLYVDHLASSSTEGKTSPWVRRYKLQPNQHLSRQEKVDLFKLSFFNMVFVGFFFCCPVYEWIWNQVQNNDNHHHRLTDADDWNWQRELCLKIPIHVLVTDVSFYMVHILLHYNTSLYQYIHKVHHRFKAPTAMACVYAHPLEFAIGNVFPIYLGPILTNAHPYTCYMWWSMAMLGTCKGHCGYRIPMLFLFNDHVDPHDDHHLYTMYNFGGMATFDILFGTAYDQKKNNNKAVD